MDSIHVAYTRKDGIWIKAKGSANERRFSEPLAAIGRESLATTCARRIPPPSFHIETATYDPNWRPIHKSTAGNVSPPLRSLCLCLFAFSWLDCVWKGSPRTCGLYSGRAGWVEWMVEISGVAMVEVGSLARAGWSRTGLHNSTALLFGSPVLAQNRPPPHCPLCKQI